METHRREITLSHQTKAEDKLLHGTGNHETAVCTFDLEATIPLPNGNISTFFYKSKLNIYNFTLFDLNSMQGNCFLWHEALAKRGANEIATCIYFYLRQNLHTKNFIFYSENCVAQNKNKYLVSMYLFCTEKLNFESITHNCWSHRK